MYLHIKEWYLKFDDYFKEIFIEKEEDLAFYNL